MNNREVNQIIKESNHSDWFKSVEATFRIPQFDYVVKKEGFADIYQLISRFHTSWKKIEGPLPSGLESSKSYIFRMYKEVDELLKLASQEDIYLLRNKWQTISQKITSLGDSNILIPTFSKASFLIEVFQSEGEKVYNGSYKYLIEKNNGGGFNNPLEIKGAFLAYEFEEKVSSQIVKRGKYEKSSISQIRNSFEAFFTQTEQYINGQFEEASNTFQKKIRDLDDLTESRMEEFSKLSEENKSTFESWLQESKNSLLAFIQASEAYIKANEELYKEKLKLEAPAAYWRERAGKLKREGTYWFWGLIACTVVAVCCLIAVLFLISSGTLKELFNETGTAIRWSVIFITFVSFLAYALRIFAKLTFSSFHLVRDAEEREQLSYVYLALKKEKNIDETERHLVMQSLFSRADSGLLKDDNSPTMPGSFVEKFVPK